MLLTVRSLRSVDPQGLVQVLNFEDVRELFCKELFCKSGSFSNLGCFSALKASFTIS